MKNLRLMLACLLLLSVELSVAENYGEQVAQLSPAIARVLAQVYAADQTGAMGRNRQSYFHVRFQRGLHHVADYGLISQRVDVLDRFLLAAEYAMQHQRPDGNFQLKIPASSQHLGQPSQADRASGVAFFMASLGSGVYALETNSWFQNAKRCDPLRNRLNRIKHGLRLAAKYLSQHKKDLMRADHRAPNRLLFNALAFSTLGHLLNDDQLINEALKFIELAMQQTDPNQGFFIEGGGHDSSYNGVAAALALRLLMLGHEDFDLATKSLAAMRWQQSRIGTDGVISTQGNTRVKPDGDGESFLGRKKDVDVGHTLEAMMLAEQVFKGFGFAVTSQRVVSRYR